MARISELIDDLEHTPPRLLRTMEMLMDGGRKIELLLGPEHRLGVRAVLETQGLYPYAKRPYFFMAGEPCWRSPYTELNIVYDEQLKAWLLMDVQSCILSLCERYNLPAPVCARPDEPSESVLARLREWCLMLKIREQTQTEQPPDGDSVLSPAQIASRFGVNPEALRKRLERLRGRDHNCFIENDNRAGNEPKYLYKLSSAKHVVEQLQQADKTSSLRPPRK